MAFSARPQLPERVRVACFSDDPARNADIDGGLASLPHVSASQRAELSGLTVCSDADERLVARQWAALLADTRRDLDAAFVEGRLPPAPLPVVPDA